MSEPRARILAKGVIPRIGPPPGPLDFLDYDELLAERRYFEGEIVKYQTALYAIADTDPRGAICPETAELEQTILDFIECCRRMIRFAEERMIKLTKDSHTNDEAPNRGVNAGRERVSQGEPGGTLET